MLEFYVTKGQELKRLDHDVVSADTTDLKAQFDLTSDFTGTITVWWRRSDKPGSTWTSTLSGNQCTIPAEALSAATDNVMYGQYDHFVFVSISDTGRTTSSECEIKVSKSAFSTNSTPGTGGSPTAYEELVEQFDELKADNQTFKDDMTQQQTEFESTVTENVDNIRYVVETETAPPIIDEASGAEITLDDSAYRQVRDLQLYGYSKQIQTTGAQLYDANGNANSVSGVTLYIDDDGYVILNGTATNDVFFNSSVESPFSGNVYVSMNNITVNGNVIFRFLNEGGAIINNFALDAVSKTASYNLMEAVHTMTIRIANGTTLNNFKMRPMINSGSSPLPWEPYSGGVASPSPDWPQPIHSVADEVNLLNLNKSVSSTYAGITVTSNGDGSFSYKGTATEQNINIWLAGNYGVETPVISLKKGKYGAPNTEALFYNGTTYLNQFNVISVPDGGMDITGIRVPSAKIGTSYDKTIYPIPLPWRPYGHNVMVRSAGAQLIDSEVFKNATSNGVTSAIDNDGYIVLNGTATATTFFATPISLNSDQQFFISANNPYANADITLRLSAADGSIAATDFPLATVNGTKEWTTKKNAANFTIRIQDGTTLTNFRLRPMLSKGSSPLPWQPYVAPSSALITLTDSLRGITVTSGGNYTDENGQQWIADYIYRRQTDGKWMLWRNCGEVVYDGSEDEYWYQSAIVSYRFITSGAISPAQSAAIASNFKLSTTQTTDVGWFVSNDGNGSRYFNSNQNSLSTWKVWLAENPQTVVYQLTTPTIEELPADVQAELNGLYTYSLHTDMWNNDGAYMNLKYVADTKTWINNKIAGLSTAMLN